MRVMRMRMEERRLVILCIVDIGWYSVRLIFPVWSWIILGVDVLELCNIG